jgi:hypothetical protein
MLAAVSTEVIAHLTLPSNRDHRARDVAFRNIGRTASLYGTGRKSETGMRVKDV